MKQYVNVSVQEKLACLSLKWIIVSLNHCGIYIPMDIFKRMTALFSRVYIMMILEIIIFLNLFVLRMKSSTCVKVLHNLEWTKENCILQTLVERKWAQKSEDQHSSCITHQWNCWGLGAHNQHSSGYQTFQDSCANLHSPHQQWRQVPLLPVSPQLTGFVDACNIHEADMATVSLGKVKAK